MPKLQAIVFDLDDTLYLEKHYAFSGFAAVAQWAAAEYGINAEQALLELRQIYAVGDRRLVFDTWLDQKSLPVSKFKDSMLQIYRDHTPAIKLDTEVRDLLVEFSTNYQLGLVTDGYRKVQRKKIAALQIDRLVRAIVVSDELGRHFWKPHEKPYREILQQLECQANQSVFVGDNPQKDFIGARNVGMFSIRITHPEGVYAHLEPLESDHAPDFQISHLRELRKAVRAIESGSGGTHIA